MSLVPEDKYEALEEEADRFLAESMSEITKHSEKADILTRWKEADRRSHEVYVGSGVALPEVRQGTFGKKANLVNLTLNSREGIAGYLPRKPRPLSHYLTEAGYNPGAPTVGTANCTGHHRVEACSHNCADSRAWRR